MSKLTVDDIDAKIKDLQVRHAKLLKRKSELAGQLQAKKAELAELVQEIKDAGFNPSTLVEDRDRLQLELEGLLQKFELDISASEEALKQLNPA